MSVRDYAWRVRGLLNFSAPVLAISFLQSLTGSINIAYISRFLGSSALAASSNANIVIFLIVGVLSGLPNSVMLQVARAAGAAQWDTVKKTFYEALIGFAVVVALLSVVIWFFSPLIMSLIKIPIDSRVLAVGYLRVMCLSMFSMLLFLFVMMALRGIGETKSPFFWIAVAVILDACFTPTLITGWGVFPRLGIEGAAWSSFFSQTVALVGMLLQIQRRHHIVKLIPCRLLLKTYSLKTSIEMFREGAPLCVQIFLGSVYALMLFAIVNSFGVTTTAAYVVVTQVWNYIQMPSMALASGTSALVAQYIGRGDWTEVWKVTKTAVLCNVVITSILVAISFFSVNIIFDWLLPGDSGAKIVGSRLNSMVAWFLVLFSSSVVLFGVLRANRVYFVPLLTFSITQFFICIPFILLFRQEMGVDAVWISFPISYVLPLVVALLYFKSGIDCRQTQKIRGY